jgi:DNA-binding NtrC family response regulator
MKRGAFDYITKPFKNDEVLVVVRNALERRRLVNENRTLRQNIQEQYSHFDNIVGRGPAMRRVFDLIIQAAPSRSTILIQGESGTGKELVARAIHTHSQRKDRAFVTVNSGNLPPDLLESTLFGHVKGAFTGAVYPKKGLFDLADKGSIFLDEIGNIPLETQAKLLRVMQEREFMRLGGMEVIKVDVRIIAATNVDLKKTMEEGRFREDLFYRLNVVHLIVPPLRERRGDIPVLVDHLVHRLNAKLGTHCLGVERDALWSLISRPWKGNVRELENVLERAIVLGGNDLISLRDLSAEATTSQGATPQDLRGAVRRFERQHLMEVLAATQSDKRKAARVLGISLASLYRKLRGEDEPGPAFSK